MSDMTISLPKEVNGHVICSTRIRHILAIRKSILMQIYMLFRQQAGISALRQELEVKTPYRAMNRKRLVRTVLIFTESSDQLSRATDRVPGLPASPGYVQ